MQDELLGLGVETFQLALYLALPALLVGMFSGLAVSIFQATTQINEMTLSFIPKIIAVIGVLIVSMPWMLTKTIEFTEHIFNLIPTFIQ